MVLVIDIGNTSITLGFFRKNKLVEKMSVESSFLKEDLKIKLRKEFKKLVRKYPTVEGVIICSVVPKGLADVKDVAKEIFHKKPVIVGKDVIVPIKNCYKDPRQVGQDRLVCAYAALYFYGGPAIVIDLGTAITLDVVTDKKEYQGGIIVPGIRLSAESLYQKTALLPRIDIHKPVSLIGKDTEGSILSGIFYGYGAMICGLISKISQKIKREPKVIVTGGYAAIMKKYIDDKVNVIDESLVLKGLLRLWCERK